MGEMLRQHSGQRQRLENMEKMERKKNNNKNKDTSKKFCITK